MKKSMFLAFSLILAVFAFTGCSEDGGSFVSKSYETEAAQVSSINIDVRDREVEVLPSEDDKIHIDYFESEKEFYDISLSDDSTLILKATDNKEWGDYIGGKADPAARKISVKIPDELLDSLNISTTNENILLTSFAAADSVSLVSNGGDILFDVLTAGNTVTLNSKNGNISGTVGGSYEDFAIECKVKKGECNLPTDKDSGGKKLFVAVNNGSANIDFSGRTA